MNRTETRYPKLRLVEPVPVIQNDQPGFLLRDPLQLAQKVIVVPEAILPLLALLDGTRENANAVSASLAIRYGVEVPPELVQQLLDALDETFLLESASYQGALAQAAQEFHALPYRNPAHAGATYPNDPDELKTLLDDYLNSVDGASPEAAVGNPVGIVSPHIDYERGGKTYAQVWKRASNLVNDADLAVILGTDHYGQETVTLTLQNYATPYGVLPTERRVVETIAQTIGPEQAFAGELRHRTEHSIELAAVWLHHIRAGRPIDVVPILCGSFRPFTQDGASAEEDKTITGMVEAFRKATFARKVIVIAAGDLAHVGPAFEGEPIDLGGRAVLRNSDAELLELICAGDAEGFLHAIKHAKDRNNVCGVPPIYLMLKLLGTSHGSLVGYDQCAADNQGTSLVSIGGVVLTQAQ